MLSPPYKPKLRANLGQCLLHPIVEDTSVGILHNEGSEVVILIQQDGMLGLGR